MNPEQEPKKWHATECPAPSTARPFTVQNKPPPVVRGSVAFCFAGIAINNQEEVNGHATRRRRSIDMFIYNSDTSEWQRC
ncbi:hypothetical protein AVEN_8028-1 [Araneus ventricosus]|uniref:Uncharacterized protein n=1 Tax=Araneus ventricosus TaxID=182803 RepID=A0A4Y2W2K8_ARAVE|nr:hypothetical protein AVEN_8028-1 [Araneus ventricosus]